MKDKSMINMAGTSMGSGVKMCGSQVGKHMKMDGPKMMGGDEKKVKNKTQVNKPQKTFSSNKDTWDRVTHKGFTDLQYNISERDKGDKIWPDSYYSGQTTAKLVAIKTGGWDKEMQRSLEDLESKHLKGTFTKNFYQGYKDFMGKAGIKTKAHQKWEADNYKHRFVKSKY